MDRDEALERIREVQRIVERTTLYTLLPGVPSIIGGAMVLVGCAVSSGMIRSLDFQAVLATSLGTQWAFCVMWTVIGVGAIALDVVLTARKARQLGLSPAARPARFAALSLSPSIFVAVVLTIEFLDHPGHGQLRYIGPVWMMCYGTGVYTAGLLSVRLPRLLGLAFIGMGGAGLAFCPQYGVVLIALSFGLLHILFGLQVLRAARRREQT